MKRVTSSFLEPGEVVLWEGRPVVWRQVVSQTTLVLFGIPLCGVVFLLWTEPGGPRTIGYWVMPGIVAFFAFAAVTAPLQAWFLARHATYLLTNRRAVVLEPWLVKFGRIDSFRVPDWKLDVVRRRDGSGEILFGSYGMGGRLGFKHLADISVVEPLVRNLAAPVVEQSHRSAPAGDAGFIG